LPNPFQHFAIRFQLFNIFQHCFSSVFQIYFIVVGSDQFQKAFFVQKCNSGAGSDQLLFLDDILWNMFSYGSSFFVFFLWLNFPRNGRPGWPIYNEKYTYLSFRCTTKRNIVVHTYAGCHLCQNHHLSCWHFSITTGFEMSIHDMANRGTPKQ
jgi:hypothetical protein